MAAPVVIQGLPAAEDQRAAALSACSDALKHRRCAASDEPEAQAGMASAEAIIAWPDGDDRHVRVVLERFDMSPARRIKRDTRFAEGDPIIERWRTVGLVIAALVGESESSAGASEASEGRSLVEPSARAGERSAGWVGLSALAGPGLDDGSVRLGGALEGAIALRSLPVFFFTVLSHALRPVDEQNVDVRWTTVALGGGARTVVSNVDIGVRVHGAVLLEYLHAGSAVTGAGSRLSPGLRGGVDVIWPASRPLGFTLGFALWSLPGGTAIQLDQRKLGSSEWLSYAGFLGGQWSFR